MDLDIPETFQPQLRGKDFSRKRAKTQSAAPFLRFSVQKMNEESDLTNTRLKADANDLIERVRLSELFACYEEWFVGGSYSYDLMCWRDLDLYVLDNALDLKNCFAAGYEITNRLSARKARFTNNLGRFEDGPEGLYWGIKLGDSPYGPWKLDVWFLRREGYEAHATYSATMRTRLTNETRAAICLIKESYWRRREYRDTITSDMIYRAVLDQGIRTIAEFERHVRTTTSE
jgi:hypothetical protein